MKTIVSEKGQITIPKPLRVRLGLHKAQVHVVSAIDSSVIFDFVIRDSAFGRDSREALESAVSEGRVVACDVVWAEIVGFFPSAQVVRQMLAELRIEFS